MDTTTSQDGTAIAYERTGTGAPVVLVSGALSAHGANAATADLLAPRFTVFNLERRGRGESGDTMPYAVEREIEDLAAVVAAAGKPASVFGMSSGGALALQAAAAGVPITKVAVYEVPYNSDDAESRQRSHDYAKTLDELLAANQRGDAVASFMNLVGMPEELVGQMRHAPMWPALEAIAPTLAYDAAVMGYATDGGTLPAPQVGGVTAPTLVLSGGASPPWMRDAARSLAECLPSGRHGTLDGQTHDVDPAVLAPALLDFFTS